jgi:hypothetical protein
MGSCIIYLEALDFFHPLALALLLAAGDRHGRHEHEIIIISNLHPYTAARQQ